MNTNKSVIEFCLWDNDDPIEIQLEPECIIFRVLPGNSLSFIANNCTSDFTWAVRVSYKEGGIQLFPECLGNYEIAVYENGALLFDIYKYM